MGEASLLYTWIDLLCIAVCGLASAAAAAIDHRTLRIPNRLTFPLILAGLVVMALRCACGYPVGPAVLACILSYAIVYGLWKFRMWGGGDAKLVLALFLLTSPAYPPLYFIAAFTLCLAILLLIKHGIYKPAVRSKRAVPWTKSGPLSAEDIASLKERPGEPMGPLLAAAYVLSVVLLEAMPW
jgi:prepilin peptidase CpaA